jgi:transposase
LPPVSESSVWRRTGWAHNGRGEREPGKSDEIDSLAVARAVVKDGVEQFPGAYLDERAMEIRLLADRRNGLIAERTRIQNWLRWYLVALCPELEASLKKRSLSETRQLDRIDRRLRRLTAEIGVRVARAQVAQIRSLTRQANTLENELLALIKAQRPQLLAETGCGLLTAAILIGRTAGAERFHTDASFALQSGIAPIKCSSGQHQQHRLNRGGDRQLNHALQIIAITRARHDPTTREYLARKQAEAKTKKGALRCLKRHLTRRFWRLLAEPPLSADQAVTREHAAEPGEPQPLTIPEHPAPPREVHSTTTAPIPMLCIT